MDTQQQGEVNQRPYPLLTADQLQQFVMQGYVTFHAGLSDEFNASLAARLDSVETAQEPNPGNNILPIVPEISDVVRAPAIKGALTSILGENYTLQPHRFAHVNHPGARPQMQHRDSFYGYYKYRSHYPWEAILFYYPRAVELAMGPTALVPFSQYSHRHAKDVEMIKKIPAGTAILCHYNLWHRGTGNSHSSSIRIMVKLQFARLSPPSPAKFPYAVESDEEGEAVRASPVDWAAVFDGCFIKDAQKEATLAMVPAFERVWRWLHGDHPACYTSPAPTPEEEARYLALLPLAAPLRDDSGPGANSDDEGEMKPATPPPAKAEAKGAGKGKGAASAQPRPVADDRAVLGAVYRLAESPRVADHLKALFAPARPGWWNGAMKAGDAKMPSIGQYVGMIGVAAVTSSVAHGQREHVRDVLMKVANDAALPLEARWCAIHGALAAAYHSTDVLRFVRSYVLGHSGQQKHGAPRFVPTMLLERAAAEGLRNALGGLGDAAVDGELLALVLDSAKASATKTIIDAQTRFTLMLSISATLQSGVLALLCQQASSGAKAKGAARKKKDRLGLGGGAPRARASPAAAAPAALQQDDDVNDDDDARSQASTATTTASAAGSAAASAVAQSLMSDVGAVAANDTNRYARGFAAALHAALAVAPLSDSALDERSDAAELVMVTRKCPFTSHLSQFVEKAEKW